MPTQVLRLDPQDPDSNVFIGRVHQAQGRGEEAIEALEAAAASDPARQLELGQVLQLEGFHVRAAEAYVVGVTSIKLNTHVHHWPKSAEYVSLQQTEPATHGVRFCVFAPTLNATLHRYRGALANDPESTAARLHLAVVLHDAALETKEGEALDLLGDAMARLPVGHIPRDFLVRTLEADTSGDSYFCRLARQVVAALICIQKNTPRRGPLSLPSSFSSSSSSSSKPFVVNCTCAGC